MHFLRNGRVRGLNSPISSAGNLTTLTAPERIARYVAVMVTIRRFSSLRHLVSQQLPAVIDWITGGLPRGGRAQRRPSNDPYDLAFILTAKLLMMNFSGLLFVDAISTPWQIW
jgi:hypothetical protein